MRDLNDAVKVEAVVLGASLDGRRQHSHLAQFGTLTKVRRKEFKVGRLCVEGVEEISEDPRYRLLFDRRRWYDVCVDEDAEFCDTHVFLVRTERTL